jgi:hypothetical protein
LVNVIDEVLVGAEYVTAAACGALFGTTKQFQPVDAAGIATTPLDAVPPVPTFIWNHTVPVLLDTDGEVPNPLEIVGAVCDMIFLELT